MYRKCFAIFIWLYQNSKQWFYTNKGAFKSPMFCFVHLKIGKLGERNVLVLTMKLEQNI